MEGSCFLPLLQYLLSSRQGGSAPEEVVPGGGRVELKAAAAARGRGGEAGVELVVPGGAVVLGEVAEGVVVGAGGAGKEGPQVLPGQGAALRGAPGLVVAGEGRGVGGAEGRHVAQGLREWGREEAEPEGGGVRGRRRGRRRTLCVCVCVCGGGGGGGGGGAGGGEGAGVR